MPTIHKTDDGRITIADAKRLILDASPLEDSINVYAQLDDDGNIDLNGPIETTLAKDVNIHERHLDASFPAACNDLGIRPRWKYNPAQTDYSGVVNLDPFYSISHAEFVRLTAIFDMAVEVGKAPAQTPAEPAMVVAASDGPAIPKSQRPDLLTPLIEKAQRNEKEPFNAAVIWPKLCEMAETQTKPLIGKTEDGIQWTDGNDDVQYLTLVNLRGRLARQAKKAR